MSALNKIHKLCPKKPPTNALFNCFGNPTNYLCECNNTNKKNKANYKIYLDHFYSWKLSEPKYKLDSTVKHPYQPNVNGFFTFVSCCPSNNSNISNISNKCK